MMQVNTTPRHLQQDAAASNLVEFLHGNEAQLHLEDTQLYYEFPLYRDLDGAVVVSKLLLVSPSYGVIVVGTSQATRPSQLQNELQRIDTDIDQIFSLLYARLIRNSALKSSRTALSFEIRTFIYAPFITGTAPVDVGSNLVVFTPNQLEEHLTSLQRETPLVHHNFEELISTLEGAKGLIRTKPRPRTGENPNSKGNLALALESEIASFDLRQKHGYLTVLDGPQRIRGLAGSGKTVVLAMKAALTHLREPEATIVYTFNTRSLYQHIQRAITRFYRQFDDRDPNWDKLKIMHAWGGRASGHGVYYEACISHNVNPISYSSASNLTQDDPFDYVCQTLSNRTQITPIYDYMFIDEGQDFPNSFLNLCSLLTRNHSMVLAYDELQNIYQVSAPSPSAYLPEGIENEEDIILYKCYRNPREILVCAHALGFGLYGSKIVQMLENREHWQDIGYIVQEGEFREGSDIVIERPEENSLTTISQAQQPQEIIQASVFNDFPEEITGVVNSIKDDIESGLLPDDILVIVVDDRFARSYLNNIAEELAKNGIGANNMHSDAYGVRDFYQEDRVTLSTVHKAKGNEAYVVYIVGVDALFSSYAAVRERNMLFSAMTRAKGWVRVSGIGEAAATCKHEIDTALENFPYLRFKYPSEEQLRIMKRDLAEKSIRKQKAERLLDQVLAEMSPDEVKRFVEHRSINKD